jgi:hypothetical protein
MGEGSFLVGVAWVQRLSTPPNSSLFRLAWSQILSGVNFGSKLLCVVVCQFDCQGFSISVEVQQSYLGVVLVI